ncbi:MAG: peptidoglycan DD-metalloendopeptidase family protein [Bacteroidales bacterium]
MKTFYLVLCGFMLLSQVWAQKRVELEKKKYKTQQEIEYSAKLLEETERTKKETLQRLDLLNFQIDKRNYLIDNLSEELEDLEISSREYQRIIESLREDLEILNGEYVKILRYSSVIGKRHELFMFILASNSVVQAYNRLMYIKRYASFRSGQMKLIQSTISEIDNKRSELEKIKFQKSITLNQKEKEAERLKGELIVKGKLVKNLKNKESELKRSIREKERIAKELTEQIEKVLEEERRKMKSKREIELTPEEKIVAGDFLKNKGRLPWPTERGVITGKYGQQAHPLIKNTVIQNNGIDITTESGSIVRALFGGTVTKVVAILGANYTVIVRHGNFYSVYQNMIDVKVKKGDVVKTMQKIGSVDDGKSEKTSVLHLEIWQNFDRMNPEEWLSK